MGCAPFHVLIGEELLDNRVPVVYRNNPLDSEKCRDLYLLPDTTRSWSSG